MYVIPSVVGNINDGGSKTPQRHTRLRHRRIDRRVPRYTRPPNVTVYVAVVVFDPTHPAGIGPHS